MRLLYKYAILLISLGIYTWFVGAYVAILLLLAAIVIIVSGFSTSKWLLSFPIISIIIGFAVMKYLTPSNSYSLPIGYSVFAFTCISYIVDSTRTASKANNKPIDVLCYLFFFPKMLAGPIVRFSDFKRQLNSCKTPSKTELYLALKILIFASFCKFVLADNLSGITAYENYGINSWLSTIMFAFQLYLDFYAYSNYAISFALLVGIKLPESFNSPYQAATFNDFWHRWNVTVSLWLRDYIYIPLGGNRCNSRWRVYSNILLTFLVSGLWHGATLPFLLWGILHGIFVITERIVLRKKEIESKLLRFLYGCYVFCIISLLWQLFKLDGLGPLIKWMKSLFVMAPISDQVIWISIVTMLTTYLIDNKMVKRLIFSSSNKELFVYKEVALLCTMSFLVLLFHSQPNINFFYFKF